VLNLSALQADWFAPAEMHALRHNLDGMLIDIDERLRRSADPADHPHPSVVRYARGPRGRPRKEIDFDFLESALKRGTQARVARDISSSNGDISISTRTLRPRALENNIVVPGPSVMLRAIEGVEGDRVRYVHNGKNGKIVHSAAQQTSRG
jgi:hypothetical protein